VQVPITYPGSTAIVSKGEAREDHVEGTCMLLRNTVQCQEAKLMGAGREDERRAEEKCLPG